MDFGDYALVLLNNQELLAGVFIVLLLFYYFALYRKLSFNIFDSFTIEMVSSAGAALTVFVLFAYGSPDKKFLFSFITCEIALYGAVFLVRYFANQTPAIKDAAGSGMQLSAKQEDYIRIFLWIVSVVFVILQLVSIKLVGLILFTEEQGLTHVNAYNDYGPLFIILFVMNPFFTVCIFIKRKLFGKFTMFDYICLLVALFSMFVSGSKGSFVTLFTAFAVVDYKFAKLNNQPKAKVPVIFLILLFGSIIFILSLNNITTLSDDSAISKLFQRIALSGDCFVIGYDDSALNFVRNGPSKTALSYISYPLIGRFIRPFSSTPITPSVVGIDLYYYAFGVDDAGSNGRHNFLSLLFWGPYWGWLLSLLIGTFIGYVRFYLFEKTTTKNIFYFVFICILASIVPACITDIYLFNSMLFMLIVLFIGFLVATVIVYELRNIGQAVLTHHFAAAQLKKRSLHE